MAFLKTFGFLALAKLLPPVEATTAGSSNMLRSAGGHLPRLLAFDAAETAETIYAEEAQAWRMLGVYMDCEGQDDGTTVCQRFLLWAAVRSPSSKDVMRLTLELITICSSLFTVH